MTGKYPQQHSINVTDSNAGMWMERQTSRALRQMLKSTEPRGVTRLDDARWKKQVWRTHVQTWGLSEAHFLYWALLWHCWDFSRPSAVIRRLPAVIRLPHSDSAPGELCPLPPSLHPCGWVNLVGTNATDWTILRRMKTYSNTCP